MTLKRCRTFLATIYAIYALGFIVSSIIFFHGRPFDPTAALLSDLASASSNLHGYLALTLATLIAAFLLIPVAAIFHRNLPSSPLSTVATACFGIGIVATIILAISSPRSSTDSTLHVQLAFASFTGIILGTMLYLIAARGSRLLIGVQIVILLFLVWEYFGPDLLTGTHFFNSLAFCEWCLWIECAIATWMLAGTLARHQYRGDNWSAL